MDVPVSFLMQQAALLYENELDSLRVEIQKMGTSLSSSGTKRSSDKLQEEGREPSPIDAPSKNWTYLLVFA